MPVITSVTPRPNEHAVYRTAPLTVAFSQPLTTNSAGALQVFSSQRGGRRTAGAAAVVSGSTLSFTPSGYAYWPGETVCYSVARTAASAAGTLARPLVGQFTTAVGGTGRGNFQPVSDPVVGKFPTSVVAGDVDNDGDLDFVAANSGGSTLSVRLNAGNGTFSAGLEILVDAAPSTLAMADVDGDGDLDLLASYSNFGNFSSATASVLLNDGRGQFSSGPAITGARPYRMVLGDVDGDADVDLVTVASGNTVGVRLNNGQGAFFGNQLVSVGDGPFDLALGDVDNDGDLDVLTANDNTNTVSVRLNNGSGTFGGGQDVVVGLNPTYLAVGDVNNDGALDFVTANSGGGGTVSVHLNLGGGTFAEGQTFAIAGITSLALADVDADSDLDLLATNVSSSFSSSYNTVNVRLNENGRGVFSGGQDLLVGPSPRSIVAADLDGDGDLDLLTANYGFTVSVRLNGPSVLATATSHPATGLALFPNPAHRATTLTGSLPQAPLAVFDALGRPVLRTTTDASGTAHLALPDELPTGVYLVRVGPAVARWVVQ